MLNRLGSLEKHLKYAHYLLKHKYYVFQEARKLGVTWRGITHDLSKFLPDEWLPYVEKFYSDGGAPKTLIDENFNRAWLRHIHRNPHHWQNFLLHEDDSGEFITLDMPDSVIREMIADWRGAGKAQGRGDNIQQWFEENRHNHKMSYKTKIRLYELLGRYDLILEFLVEVHHDDIPPVVTGIGLNLNKDKFIFVVSDLSYYEKKCWVWFDWMQTAGYFSEKYTWEIYEEDEPKPEMIAFLKVLP